MVSACHVWCIAAYLVNVMIQQFVRLWFNGLGLTDDDIPGAVKGLGKVGRENIETL